MKKVYLSFSQWLDKKYCYKCELPIACEKCFVRSERDKWISLVKEWFKESFK
jgi:hypothetical protein